MLLVIDVGNTNMVFGVFDGEKLIANWRLSTQSGRTADETGLMIRNLFEYSDVSVSDIEAVIVSSVVPNVMYSTLN
ncbi:MAG: type III pantothenate kinase, partial [Anaerotignum sp.]|nr:type III pantothenate kinase [Anaerotignum sp.]